MKVYQAGRLRLRGQLRDDRIVLEAEGHRSTATWLDDVGGTPEDIAARDLHDIDRADVIIVRGHNGRNGGLMFECGYGLAQGKRVLHVAAEREPRKAFMWDPRIEYFCHYAEALDAITPSRRKVVVA